MNRFPLFTCAAFALTTFLFAGCGKQSAKAKPAEKPAAAASAKPASAEPASPYKTVDQKVSYFIGYNVGSGLARENVVAVDQAAIRAGLADGLAGTKSVIPQAELQAALTAMQQKARAASTAASEKQQAAATEFLAKNKTRPGVTTTASGLQYEILEKGTGPKPKETDTVEVHYHGTLLDGTVFDSSIQRGQTVQFRVTGVIPGWIEALQLMPVGSKWKLFIPPALGYGAQGQGNIPANSLLIFEVQLISIK